MEDAKEEIRARLPVEEVVGQYVELKRAGRNLKGRSPWGVDKTPSFMVSPDKGIWHDFSANKGGDIFTFIMEVEGITFKEALEKLAAMAGVELQRYGGGDKAVTKRKVRMRELLNLACKYYQFCLSKNRRVSEYVFYKRGLNKKIVQEFKIGYSPMEGRQIVKWLTEKGYSEAEMREAGLLNRRGGDFFRGRMTVPFMDTNGQVIGFTARVLDKSEPKYLNTPESLLFNKGRFVFGLCQANEAIRREGYVVVVEGNMDVISSHQAGVKTAVATSGTAMTEQHLKRLGRMTGDIRLAYDGDDAGVRATERAIMMAGGMGLSLSVISDYQGAKDPDELIQRGAGLWQKAVEEREPAVEWLLGKYEERLDLTTGDGKREYSDVAMRVIGYLKDPVERKHYEQKVARLLGVEVEDLKAKNLSSGAGFGGGSGFGSGSSGFGGGSSFGSGGSRRRLKKVTGNTKTDREKVIEENLLALMIYGGVGGDLELEVPEDEGRLNELEMVFNEKYKGKGEKALKAEVRALAEELRKEKLRGELVKISAELAECEDDEEKTEGLLRKYEEVRREVEG